MIKPKFLNKKSFDEFKQISIDIILKRDVNGNLQKVKDAQKLKEVEKKKKEQQKELEDIFRKMGKDPSKMKKVAM
jgi:hypothetical protein